MTKNLFYIIQKRYYRYRRRLERILRGGGVQSNQDGRLAPEKTPSDCAATPFF